MYVWARLTRVVANAYRRGPISPTDAESRLTFRCLPTDIDPNIHLNNARYMMLADLGRFDLLIRTGLLAAAKRSNWVPMMGGVQAVYGRQIKLWQKFHVVSSFETWTGTQFVGRHRFELDDGRTAAMVMTTAGIYDRAGHRYVTSEELAEKLGLENSPRDPDACEQQYLTSHDLIRSAIKDMNRQFSNAG
jgi:acyl-CoA thioesterase FadM